MLSNVPRQEPQPAFLLSLLLLAAGQFVDAQTPRYERILTIGSESGVNPDQRFSGKAGKFAFGRPERMSALAVPDSVAVDPDERIWITDRGDPSVHMFDFINGRYKVLRGSGKIPFQEPAGIDTDRNGNVYVADAASGRVFVFDKDGEFLRFLGGWKIGPLVTRPMGIAVSHDLKSIYLTDPPNHRVVVLNQEGETVREWGGLGTPVAVSVDGARDRIFVTDVLANRVDVFSAGGHRTESLTWPRVPAPTAFAVDPETGWYFVGDARYRMIHIFDETGQHLGSFEEPGADASNIRVDAQGRGYVVDAPGSRVLIFRRQR